MSRSAATQDIDDKLGRKVMFELSYKTALPDAEIIKLLEHFDAFSVFYGAPYGFSPSFKRLMDKLVLIRSNSNKPILINAAPTKFSGTNKTDVRLMPCLSLVTEFWSKNWHPSRGSGEVKITDPDDLVVKTRSGFLESGRYTLKTIVPTVEVTVEELFKEKNSLLRKDHEKIVIDEVTQEISGLSPSATLSYISFRFHPNYFVPLVNGYSEQLISTRLFSTNLLENYSLQDKVILRNWLIRLFDPKTIDDKITALINIITENGPIKMNSLISRLELSK